MTRLTMTGVTLAYGARRAVAGLDLAVPSGRLTALVGRNGCGKSTILRGLARIIAPGAGVIALDGRALAHWPSRALARRLAFLPQHPSAPEGLSVHELVAYGRYPHQTTFGGDPGAQTVIEAALDAVGLRAMAARPLASLSGGERQRAWIALALAQDAPILLLDEPTTYLDLGCQLDVLNLLRTLVRRERLTVVLSLHDINLASRFADHLVMLRDGAVVAAGPPASVITPANIATVFAVEARVATDPDSGAPSIWPLAAITAPA